MSNRMDRLGDRLKRHFQWLSRSTTPEPPPDIISRPEPPTNIAPSVAPTLSGSTSDAVIGAPVIGASPILPIMVATAPVSANPPTTGPEASVSRATWTGLKLFVGVLRASADVFGPLRQAVDAFAELIGVFETSMEAHEEYKTLRAELDGLFHDLAGGFGESIPPGMRPSIVNLARGIEQEISFFRRKEHKNTLGRYAEASRDVDQVLYRCRRIRALLERLTLNANVKIWMLVDEQTTASSQRLDKLAPSHAAWYNSAESGEVLRDECTPDTRLEVLERFRVWQDDSKSEKVYWLNGMAGTGKTTLAYTLCKRLEDDNRLAGNFFCTRQLLSCGDAKLILPTIAYQLADFSYPFRYALSQILGENRDVHTRRISEQFEKLLYKPLQEVQHSLPYDLVVVIDGLDECENDRSVGEILDALLSHVSDMPIKFFLTSRPEPAIRRRMLRREGDRDRFESHLHELDKGVVREDIKKYLQAGLKYPDFTLSNEHLEILTERSGVLFIYAATVVRYISAYDFLRSDDRLKDVLEVTTGSNGSDQAISSLYNLVLERAFGDSRLIAHERGEMRLVLETVICAQEPLTVRVMASILGLKGEQTVHAALGLLRSVLNVQQDGIITTLHKSFPDHMLDPTRSLGFCCDPKERHGWLARRCFDFISIPNPPFNICGSSPLYVLDDILGPDQQIKQQVSGALLYAYRHWATHLRVAERPGEILDRLRGLLLVQLLLSLEVVNLMEFMHPGIETSSQAKIPELGERTGWGLVTRVVAVAISLQRYDLALEWFEQGHSILWGQTLQRHTPYDDLYVGSWEIVKQLQRVLYQPKCLTVLEEVQRPSADDGGTLHGNSWKYRLAERRKELLDFARLLPELGDSLRPPNVSKLVSLVRDGVAVILNADGDRCDALVIRAGTQKITHVPLPGFSVQNAVHARARLAHHHEPGPGKGNFRGRVSRPPRYTDELGILWRHVVQPVLHHLEITQVVPTNNLPHVTWCTTGPLSFLPFHAAGDYERFDFPPHPFHAAGGFRGPVDPFASLHVGNYGRLGIPSRPPHAAEDHRSSTTILANLAVSSYTPTISFLSQRTSSPSTFSGILAVGQMTPIHGFSAIPCVKTELDQIQVQANCLPFTRLDGENACTDTVLKAMPHHSWVHFACHGSQNRFNPMKSALHLHGGDLDLSTIARNQLKNAQLAYLSSCETAIGHSGLPDGPTLAAGLLMAGYPTVIATMWPIIDEDAAFVAEKVYECLLEGGVPDSRRATKALHMAVASLREKVGVDQFTRWVPFVHIGC